MQIMCTNMQFEDCYFYIDDSQPEEERNLNVLCIKCHEHFPDLGWFWQGSKHGYGPYDFVCAKCQHIVYSPTLADRGNSETS